MTANHSAGPPAPPPGPGAPRATQAARTAQAGLSRVLAPRSVAVVGASPSPGSFAGRTILTLAAGGFDGDIAGVNPRYAEVHGFRCVPSVGDLGPPPDLVVVAVEAGRAVTVLEECASLGVGAAVVLSAGFGEVQAGAPSPVKARLDAVIGGSGLRVMGPNNQGFVNFPRRTAVTFSPVFGVTTARAPGGFARFAVVSHSGAMGFAVYRAGTLRGMSFSHVVTTGNEADVDVAEVLEFLAADEDTHGVLVYAEGFPRLDRLLASIGKLTAAGKPAVVAKVGRSAAGTRAALSHTAHLAGDDQLIDAVLAAAGATRAVDQQDLIDYGLALAARRPVRGRRAGIVATSGGAAVWLADASESAGLSVPEFGAVTREALRGTMSDLGARGNPVDLTAGMDSGQIQATVRAVDASADVDLIEFNTVLAPDELVGPKLGVFTVLEELSKPVFVYSQTGIGDQAVDLFAAAGIPHYESPGRAAAAAAVAARFSARPGAPAPVRPRGMRPLRSSSAVVPEHDVKRWLRDAGLRVPAGALVGSAGQAAEAAAKLSGLLALKVHSAGIPHKMRVGGVALDIASPEAAAAAYHEVRAAVAAAVPGFDGREMLLEEMVRGNEYIVGAIRHDSAGPAVLVGRGGVTAEDEQGAVLRLAPVTPEVAREMAALVRGSGSSPAGAVAAEVDAIAEVIAVVSHAIADEGANIAELDLNPVVYNVPRGAVILDAIATVRSAEPGRPDEPR